MFTSVGLAGLTKEKLEGLTAELPHLPPVDLPGRQRFQAIRVNQRVGVFASGRGENRVRGLCVQESGV